LDIRRDKVETVIFINKNGVFNFPIQPQKSVDGREGRFYRGGRAGLAPEMLAGARKTGKIYENENPFGFVRGFKCELDFHPCG
jgi:hypothetical protein